jgi:N-acylneuraminate cytidylyltransferase
MKLFTTIKANSSRIDYKNFQTIEGETPLWKWSIQRLISDKYEIFVNTDSGIILDEISDMKNVYGIKRKEKHIEWEKNAEQIGSPGESMLFEFCNDKSISPEEVICTFHVTSPFTTLELIEDASKYLKMGYDSVQSVQKIQNFVFKMEDEKIVPINYNASFVQRTQDLKPLYASIAAFFISTKLKILKDKKRIPGKVFNYELDALQSVEIDYPDDLKLSRLVVNSMLEYQRKYGVV